MRMTVMDVRPGPVGRWPRLREESRKQEKWRMMLQAISISQPGNVVAALPSGKSVTAFGVEWRRAGN